MIFGMDQDNLMIISLVFLGVSGFYYIWLWVKGFINEGMTGDKAKQPWE